MDGSKIRSWEGVACPEYPESMDLKITDFCDANCIFCVLPGTQISTPDGLKNIEDIQNGDKILSVNTETKKTEIASVEQVFVREYDGEMVQIEAEDGSILTLTPDDEVWTENRGWIFAKNIESEDIILSIK
jgi:hypothetical protein